METKIAAFGESDIMLIFKAAGIEVFPVEAGAGGTAEIEKKLSELVKEGYGIIFVTETIALKLDRLIRGYAEKMTPSIVVIPGLGKRNDYAVRRLRRAIIKAVGVDIMSEAKENISEK
jgi:V/A-type H+-transporting ATPase subunit F